MKVSVITVCYNAEKTIADAMASVGRQRFETFERFEKFETKYLPICTTVMRMGGLSTGGFKSNLEINREDLRALRAHGCWSCLPLVYLKYLFKIWGFVFRGRVVGRSGRNVLHQ